MSSSPSILAVFRAVFDKVPWTRIFAGFSRHLEMPGKRRELLSSFLLDPEGDYLGVPGCDWKPAPGQPPPPASFDGYPHEIAALKAFGSLLPTTFHPWPDVLMTEELTSTKRLICSGSPKANALTRNFLASFLIQRGEWGQQYETELPAECLHYAFGEDFDAPKVQVVSKMHAGKKQWKTRKAVWYRDHGDWHPWHPWHPQAYGSSTVLKSDFLLVSRLPRTQFADILILAGGHGAGTESVWHLLHKLDIAELRDLAKELDNAPYYQFVLEVTGVKHENTGTVPTKVRLAKKLEPRRLPDLRSTALRR